MWGRPPPPYLNLPPSLLQPPSFPVVQYRIVFDEGHNVKSGGAQQSKAGAGLRSDRRWCCTGTPIGTSIEDLLGQVCRIGRGQEGEGRGRKGGENRDGLEGERFILKPTCLFELKYPVLPVH